MPDTDADMSKRNLLICFDAFGTLYTPKRPIAEQYGEVARSLGLGGFCDEDVTKSFKAAFKQESKRNPNYGKATGLGAEKWWTNIIHNTFKPYAPPGQPLPSELAPKLIHRFNSSEGFSMYPDVQPLIQKIRGQTAVGNGQVVVGVITNSDDRTPEIVNSLGLRVRPIRFGSEPGKKDLSETTDFDFVVMSYDVGHEKPDKRMFAAAESLTVMLARENVNGRSAKDRRLSADWQKIYVGDEYDKDVIGAVGAGWNAVLIDRETSGKRDDIEWLDEREPVSLVELFARAKAVGFSSLAKFAEWLPSRP